MNKLVEETKALNIPRQNLMLNEGFLELFDRKKLQILQVDGAIKAP